MPFDPKSSAREVILSGALAFEPPLHDMIELRVPAIRRVMPHATPPLDLAVIPFRYRVQGDRVVALRPRCEHRGRRR